MARGGAEVPHPGLAVAGQQAPARELVARPLADDRAREIADVVLVEDEHGAEPGGGQRLAGAAETVGVQAAEVHALLEVHLHVAGRLQRPIPAVARVHVVGRDGPGRSVPLPSSHRGLPVSLVDGYSTPGPRSQPRPAVRFDPPTAPPRIAARINPPSPSRTLLRVHYPTVGKETSRSHVESEHPNQTYDRGGPGSPGCPRPVGGDGGALRGAPSATSRTEGRRGFPGPLPAVGMGGASRPQALQVGPRGGAGFPGRPRAVGVWGALRGPKR